ncbi:hypothetical protein BCR33DRAFT_792636 [Rhizoclosmatium globosum]|uniref:Amino acid permease/ SLC12A domain-containing protein n=1 Tax=Rhizoclosmatium globosum TaxID=329046 RepID=A0A1Y2B720_9FUNG|nr:hypothetical protein BCR33DRAFT_792636 [Rhizoclosmatium globosum]|eukprot:ORY30524.1 hypothetical protein BCR33DRAFT_792636 [Rhizoclosmatium globosum]
MRTRSEVEVEVGGSDASFLYESRCGKELNLIRSDDSPIVFHSLSEDSNLNWAGSFHAPFQPHRIFCSESTGRLYHPMPEELKTVLAPWQMSQNNYKDKDKEGLALLRSALVQMHFADSLDHDSLFNLDLFDGPTSGIATPQARRPIARALLSSYGDFLTSDSVTPDPLPHPSQPISLHHKKDPSSISNSPPYPHIYPAKRAQPLPTDKPQATYNSSPTSTSQPSKPSSLQLYCADGVTATLLTLSTALSMSAFGSSTWTRREAAHHPSAARPITPTTPTPTTATRPKHGGVYFMISRSLGKVIGGAVCCIFYFGVLMGVAVLVNGFSKVAVQLEVVDTEMDGAGISQDDLRRVYGTGFLVVAVFLRPFSRRVEGTNVHRISMASAVCFGVAVVGLVLSGVGVVVYAGLEGAQRTMENFVNNFGHPAVSSWDLFFETFGFFIPCVSGVLSGSSRSAELHNPRKHIPKYSIAAQITTSLLYFFFIVSLAVAFDRQTLLENTLPTAEDSSSILLQLLGLSSGLQLQLLQAVSNDEVLPFLRVFKKRQAEGLSWWERVWNAWKGRIVGFLVVEFTILVGTADTIVHVFAVLYLMCYVFFNGSIAVLGVMESPSWRPSWNITIGRYPPLRQLCLCTDSSLTGVQLSILFFIVMLIFVKLISYYDAKSQYGKSTNTGASAVLLQIAKRNLWEVEAKGGGDSFGLDWRPHIMLLVDTTTEDGCWYVRRENKLELLSHMKKGDIFWVLLDGGILTLIAHILMKHPSWQTCKFRIFVIAEAVDNVEAMHENLKATLKGLRIAAEANVLVLEREGKSALCPGTELMSLFGSRNFGSVDQGEDDHDSRRSSQTSFRRHQTATTRSLGSVCDLGNGKGRTGSFHSFDGIKRQDSPLELPSTETLVESNTASLRLIRLLLASKLNALIKSKVKESKLILCNLPCPVQASVCPEWEREYIEFLAAFSDGLNDVIFVKGSGNEVVTDFY